MSLDSLISNGGKILIVVGYSKAWENYRNNPQLEFWTGEQKDISRYLRDKEIPSNTKAIFISRFISHSELDRVLSEARKKNITLFPNKSDGEIIVLLDEITKGQPKKVEDKQVKGKLNALIPFIDFSKTHIENARILFIKAKELNISTTKQSLAQFVATQRKKQRGTGFPQVVKNKNKLDLSVEMFDFLIKDMQGMRDYLIETVEENRILKTKLDKFKKALEE